MGLIAETSIDVLDSFKELVQSIQQLNCNINQNDKDLPAWFAPPTELIDSNDDSARAQVADFLSQLEYVDKQNPKEIIIGPGLIASSQQTIDLARQVNAAKAEFKKSVISLKQQRGGMKQPSINNSFNTLLDQLRPESLSKELKRMGLSRLHLKQCYRIIPILDEKPTKVSWTWANTKAITKISKARAFEMLTKKPMSPEINFQLEKLKSVAESESLAVVQILAPHLRANLVFKNKEDELSRKMIKGAMPILYPEEDIDRSEILTLPEFTPPKTKPDKAPSRSTRSDVKLDSEPFLPAIRAYRYL